MCVSAAMPVACTVTLTKFVIYKTFFKSKQKKFQFLFWLAVKKNHLSACMIARTVQLGGVYMRILAMARVSYRHDFLILYRVYMMTGPFHISLFEGTLHVDKMHV